MMSLAKVESRLAIIEVEVGKAKGIGSVLLWVATALLASILSLTAWLVKTTIQLETRAAHVEQTLERIEHRLR